MHDFTNMVKPDQDPDFTKFMNQSSSQRLELADEEPNQARSPPIENIQADDIYLNDKVNDMTTDRRAINNSTSKKGNKNKS